MREKILAYLYIEAQENSLRPDSCYKYDPLNGLGQAFNFNVKSYDIHLN